MALYGDAYDSRTQQLPTLVLCKLTNEILVFPLCEWHSLRGIMNAAVSGVIMISGFHQPHCMCQGNLAPRHAVEFTSQTYAC